MTPMTPMNTDPGAVRGSHHALTENVSGTFYGVYNERGFGSPESVCSASMHVALSQAGLRVEREVPIPVMFRGPVVGTFRAGLIADGVIELKSCEGLNRPHEAQTLHYPIEEAQ